jgi:hypothetical protein
LAVTEPPLNLVPIKEADRTLKNAFGRAGELPGDPYSDLKKRLIEQAYEDDLAEEQVIQRRIESLTENVRREVEAELADEWGRATSPGRPTSRARGSRDREREAGIPVRGRPSPLSARGGFKLSPRVSAPDSAPLLLVVPHVAQPLQPARLRLLFLGHGSKG